MFEQGSRVELPDLAATPVGELACLLERLDPDDLTLAGWWSMRRRRNS